MFFSVRMVCACANEVAATAVRAMIFVKGFMQILQWDAAIFDRGINIENRLGLRHPCAPAAPSV